MLTMAQQLAAWLTFPIRRRLGDAGHERGANIVEYVFLVALIAVVCLVAVTFFGHQTSHRFSVTASAVEAS